MRVNVTTKSGFECTIENNDWKLLKMLREADKDELKVIDAADYALGKKQMGALEKHCTVDGVCGMMEMLAEITEIINNAVPKKS